MDAETLCEKLKPVIGDKKANRFWLMYLRADYRRKKEIETILNIYYSKLLKKDLDDNKILLRPPPPEKAQGEYRLGKVTYNNNPVCDFGLREPELLRHISILGQSGGGKSNIAYRLIQHFIDKEKPFMCFDFKRTFRDMLPLIPENKKKDFLVFTVGSKTAPLTFNPLICPKGVEPDTWLKQLNQAISHSYYLGEGCLYILQVALDGVYKDFGVYDGSVTQWPTMLDVLKWLQAYPAKGREANWMSSTLRAVQSMCFGGMGRVLNTPHQQGLEELMQKYCVIELHDLAEGADKTFLIESLLLWIHYYRRLQPEREQFKFAVIIEESHHVLRKSIDKKESVVERLIREVREFGVSISFLDQTAAHTSDVALSNTYCTIAMNTKHASNVNAVAQCLQFEEKSSEKDYLGELETGTGIVKLQSRWTRPFLVKFDLVTVQKGTITDEAIRKHMRSYLNDKNSQQPQNSETSTLGVVCIPDKLKKEEQELLEDIMHFSSSGIIERYRRLGFDSFLGNASKEALTNYGLIKTISIPTSRARLKILELTEQGKIFLRESGHTIDDSQESAEHKYWKNRIAKYFSKSGCKTTIEYQMGGGKSIDVMVEKPNRKVAVEIETGKSDEVYNILKCLEADIDLVLSVGITKEVVEKIEQQLANKGLYDTKKISVLPAKDFEADIQQRNLKKLENFVKNKVVTIAGHYDCDGLTSVALIYHTIQKWAKKINLVTKGIPYEITPEDLHEGTEKVICADIRPNNKIPASQVFYLDHHPNEVYWQSKHAIYDENSQSCADLIFQELLSNTEDPYLVFLALLGYFGDNGSRENIPSNLMEKAQNLIPDMLKENTNQTDKSTYLEIQRHVSTLNTGKRMLWNADFILTMLCETKTLNDFLGQKHPAHERINQLKKDLKRLKKHKLTPKQGSTIDFAIIKSEFNIQGLLASSNLDNKPLLVINAKDDAMIGSLRVPEHIEFDAHHYIQGLKEKMNDILGGGHEKAAGISFPATNLKEFIELLR